MAPMFSCVTAPAEPASVSLSERRPYSLSCVSRRTVSLPAVAVMMTSGRADRIWPTYGVKSFAPSGGNALPTSVPPRRFDIVLKRGNAAAAHLIVGADEEIAFTRHVFRQP